LGVQERIDTPEAVADSGLLRRFTLLATVPGCELRHGPGEALDLRNT
jgi:hypothetical protein